MESKMYKIAAKMDDNIQLKVIPGHFATTQSHINSYLDITTMKSRIAEASRVATVLSQRYETSVPVDTIVCLDGMEVIGSFLASELKKAGVLSYNAHKTIYVVTPEIVLGQLVFRDNLKPMINGKNIIVLMGLITTGSTLNTYLQSINNYGGIVQGVSSIFSAANKVAGMDINAIYYASDIPGYESYTPSECPACRKKEKIDALVNGYGYSKL